MFRENRLIGLTQEDLAKQRKAAGASQTSTIYNKRTAEANATVQSKGKTGGSDAGVSGSLEAQSAAARQLQAANTVYNAAAQGKQTAAIGTPGESMYDPKSVVTAQQAAAEGGTLGQLRDIRQAGQEGSVDTSGNVVNQGAGVLEGVNDGSSAMAAAATPEQIAQNQQNLKGIANYGFGVSPAEASEAAKLEAQKNEVAGATAYRLQVNSDGSKSYVVDKEGTAKAQEDVKNRQAQQNLADATAAKLKSEQDAKNSTPSPTIDSFLAGVPPDQKAEAQAIFQPLFDWMESQKGKLDQMKASGEKSINSMDSIAQEFFAKQKDQNDSMFKYFAQMNKDSLGRQLEISQDVHDAQLRDAEYQRDRSDSLYERAIRDQILKNEDERKNQLLGLGISGGWRASRQTADVISALAKGDRTLGDLYTDAAFASRDSANQLMKVESTYHSNVLTAYDSYYGANSKLFNDFTVRASDIDKTIFNTMKEKNDAIRNLNNDYVKEYGNLAGKFAETVKDQNKYVIDSAKDMRKQQFDQNKEIWDRAQDVLAKTGTQNKALLASFEQQLGIAPGSLSNAKTLAELRLYKGVGGGGGVDLGQIADFATSQMDALDQIYGNGKSREEKARMVLNSYDSRFGGTKAGKVSVGKAADYLNTFYGQGYVPSTDPNGGYGPGIPDQKFFLIPERSPIVELNQTVNYDEILPSE